MGQNNHNTKRQKWKHLSERERYEIEALLKAKQTPLQIARQLGRDRRTIEREIKRGAASQRDTHLREREEYLADVGQRKAQEKAKNKGRGLKIGSDHALARHLN